MFQNQLDSNASSSVRGPLLGRLRVTLLGVACIAFGLLIWSRLLLVTSYPKTAIAEPPASKAPAIASDRTATADATTPD